MVHIHIKLFGICYDKCYFNTRRISGKREHGNDMRILKFDMSMGSEELTKIGNRKYLKFEQH